MRSSKHVVLLAVLPLFASAFTGQTSPLAAQEPQPLPAATATTGLTTAPEVPAPTQQPEVIAVPPQATPAQAAEDASPTAQAAERFVEAPDEEYEEMPALAKREGWHAWAWDRVAASTQSAVAVSRSFDGSSVVDPSRQSWNRARFGMGFNHSEHRGFIRAVDAAIEGDLDRGTLDVDASSASRITLRKGYVEAKTLAGQFTIGRQASGWGLGLVAQSGVEDPLQFGLRRGGTIVDRLQYGILPAALWSKGDPAHAFPLAIAVAYDRVVADDLVRGVQATDGVFGGPDDARNKIIALLYQGQSLHAGLYAAWRHQTDVANQTMSVQITDAFLAYTASARDWRFGVSAEGVIAHGATTWLRTMDHQDSLDIEQYGGVARIDLSRRNVHVRLEGGVASGDGQPLDGTLRNFSFASDYRVGLVLFPVVMAGASRVTQQNFSDPRFASQPPVGIDRLPTHGAVSQAMYLHPVVKIHVSEHFSLMGGAVFARAPADYADAYQTFLRGGAPTGPRGAAASRDLGSEFDGAVEVVEPLPWHFQAVLRGDAGFALLGHAFDDPQGHAAPAVGVVQGSFQVRGQW